MQHAGLIERNPDLAGVRLAIIRFPSSGGGRGHLLHVHDGGALLSFEELDARVRTVYATWAAVSDERLEKRRAAGGGGGTPMGF